MVAGGHRHSLGGRFFEPTVIDGVAEGMLILKEETFGPVAPIVRFKDEAMRSAWPMPPSSVLPPISMPATCRGCGASPRASRSGIIGINTGLISTEVARSAGSNPPASAGGGIEVRDRGLPGIKYLCMGI